MSETEKTATDSDAAGEVNVEPVGIDEMVRQERVRSIFDARNTCRKQRTKAKRASAVGEADAAPVIYQTALESYIREVEPLFSQTKKGQRYWSEYQFGTMQVTPDIKFKTSRDGQRRTLKQTGSVLKGDIPKRVVEISGLKSLFELGSPMVFDMECNVRSRGMSRGESVETVTVQESIAVGILDEMYAVTNGYLGEIGFGVEVGKAKQHTKLDDDLLDEVEQWRRENL